MNNLKFIDLFSGIGGFRSALEMNGHECIGFSEVDSYAIQSYKTLYDTENEIELGDITKVSDEEFESLKGEVDLVVGGSPCFRAGTLITTSKGLKPIEDIKKGDLVLTHRNRYKPVVMPMVTHTKSIYKIEVKDCETTYATEEHPFLVIESDEVLPHWVKAKDLDVDKHFIQLGETVNSTSDIEFSPLLSLEKEETDELVYNFEVEDDNSYVANNLVAHNCQSFSNTGLKRGFEDTRGTLFFDYARAVKHVQPKVFLYENVKGLIAHDKMNTIKVVLETFDELGYYIDFHIFNSKFYDVPQNRERIYIVGKRKDLVSNPIPHDRFKGRRRIVDVQNWARENISFAQLMPPLKDEVTTQLSDVLEDYVDEKYFLREDYLERVRKQITENERKPLRVGEPNRIAGIWNSPQAGSVFDVRGISRSLDTSMGGYREPIVLLEGEQINARKITPLEAWRLQGFTDEQFKKVKDVGMSDWQLYIQAGNAVTVNVVDYIVKHILK